MLADSDKKLKVAGIIFLFIVVAISFADYKIYQKKQQLIAQINAYQNQIAEIKKSSQNLKDEIANSNNADYLEKIGYEQLNQTRPGEKEVIFIAPKEKPALTSAPQNNWFYNAWSWIKSKF